MVVFLQTKQWVVFNMIFITTEYPKIHALSFLIWFSLFLVSGSKELNWLVYRCKFALSCIIIVLFAVKFTNKFSVAEVSPVQYTKFA